MGNIQHVKPGLKGQVINEYGEPQKPPVGWVFLPAGDAGVTRKVTAKGHYWRVQVKKGRRTISKGVWAPAVTISEAKMAVAEMRQTDDYQKKRISTLKRRDTKQNNYKQEFCLAVEQFLCFDAIYEPFQKKLASAVTEHTIPIGSGTVARTQMIPLEERAAKAVVAWMRHNTTVYDKMKIGNIKGQRRIVKRTLAYESQKILINYRLGRELAPGCPLAKAILAL